MRTKMFAIAVAALMVITLIPLMSAEDGDAAASSYKHGDFLVDYGNGSTKWVPTAAKDTIWNTVEQSLTGAGITCSIAGSVITVDGRTETTIGAAASGGSITAPGTTGITVTSSWKIYNWSNNANRWDVVDPSNYGQAYAAGRLAVGFYPDGIGPAETPNYKTAWTMICGDAENSTNQWAEIGEDRTTILWSAYPELKQHAIGSYATALFADGHIFVKFGSARIGNPAYMTCYDAESGDMEWEFGFESDQIEMGAALIVGENIYIQSTVGYIYTFNWKLGPGDGNANVKQSEYMPDTTIPLEFRSSYGQGPTSMVFDSGCIFVKSHNGMVYCFSKDLDLIWSYQMLGPAYYSPVTVMDDYVFAGTYDGCLYILNKYDGTLIHKEIVFQTVDSDLSKIGSCATPVLVRTATGYRLFTTYSDGLGMNSHISSLKIYDFNTGTNEFTQIIDFNDYKDTDRDIGTAGTLLTRYETEDFKGIIIAANNGIFKIDTDGNNTLISDVVSKNTSTRATPTLVNNEILYVSTYGTQELFQIGLDGTVIGKTQFDNRWFAMATVCVVDGYIIRSDDNGVAVLGGSILDVYVPPTIVKHMPLWQKMLIAIAIIVAILAVIWLVLRFAVGWQQPFHQLHDAVMRYFFGENYSHNTKSKRRLRVMIVIGILITMAAALASLCLGSETNMTLNEALSSLISSIQKNGRGLDYNEMLIYNQRLPRALATIGVGIGLSVAGAMYQAIIKNPLVEPYIMGVSSGAGTFAVAVILSGFTFFGLFSPHSTYLTAVSAIVGGLLAFGLTMLIAEKTGGKSINYVLAGIVIGLVFSAIQSILMIQSGTKMSNALSWLYGSFASITWDKLWLVLIPCITLSCIPLVWAKEFNLILLGEDQAIQMGLNAKRFDRIMLIMASVLTAFCVAFCGIIGFVGLVIPHLSRMIMGGDHRLMLPVSMAFGGCLMTVADLLARMLLTGYELPVGAITTIIGVPVFAYLLIRKGGRYDA